MSALSQKKQTSSKSDTLHLIEKQKTLNSFLIQVLEHAGFNCEHCKGLLENRCDKCGKYSQNLEKVNPHSDHLYCPRCLECEI